VSSIRTPLRFTDDVDDYFRNAAGACLRRTRFFCSSPGQDLFTLFAWGRLDAQDTRELFEVFDSVERNQVPPRRQLVVLRRVESVSIESMGIFTRYYERGAKYLQSVAKEAVVRPGGVVGILAEGFYPVVPRPFPGKVFSSLGHAIEWLGFDQADLDHWLEQVTDLERRATSPSDSIVSELRRVILQHGAGVSVGAAAQALGVSARTLQRRIREGGGTFEGVRTFVCLEEAKRLLLTSDHDVKHIALELGYASPTRLTDVFRREFGVPPTRWRESARSGRD